ncbi:hypothetical protein [Paenibacillus sp. OV219]|uniref:hypothetical protein n=1 Tax=Paenibacillus sp. OV219 TaxID=1884377 RepID=UPI00116034F7|nr:hypothetical protein [Paenibacillus sp. OV219]
MTLEQAADELADRICSIWSEALSTLLQAWPALDAGAAGTYELCMNDIFHDDCPMDDVPWRRPGYRAALVRTGGALSLGE